MEKPNKNLYITVGISASGKSTWAKEFILTKAFCEESVQEINRDEIRFNVVCPGADWSSYVFNEKNEEEVSRIALERFEKYASIGHDIIISDTNLNEHYRNAWINRGVAAGYKVCIVEFPIYLEDALDRDSNRENSVGRDVIIRQHNQWLNYLNSKS